MKSLRTVTSITALLALGALTACNDKTESDAAAPVEEAAAVVEQEVVEPVAEETEAMTEDAPAAEDKPFVAFTETREVTATVEAIDLETREVTLLTDNGEISFVAGDEVQNLAQVRVGDVVVAGYMKQLTLEVIDGEGLDAEAGLIEIAERAEAGDMPGMMASETEVRVFMVEAIDLEDNSFKLRNVDGQVQEFTARNPENLKRAQVGDALIATMTNAVAVTVVPIEQ